MAAAFVLCCCVSGFSLRPVDGDDFVEQISLVEEGVNDLQAEPVLLKKLALVKVAAKLVSLDKLKKFAIAGAGAAAGTAAVNAAPKRRPKPAKYY